MTHKDKENKAFDALHKIYECAYGDPEEIDTLSLHEVQSELKENGINPSDLVRTVRQRMEAEIGKQKRALATEALLSLQSKFQQISSNIAGLSEQAKVGFQELLQRNPATAQAYFRKFEQGNQEDLKHLIQDLEAIDKLDDSKNQ